MDFTVYVPRNNNGTNKRLRPIDLVNRCRGDDEVSDREEKHRDREHRRRAQFVQQQPRGD